MIIDTAINKYIDEELVRENKKREAEHEPSGKLSASMLYQPLRFQILKTLGVPRKPFDPYTLAKFLRGWQVEDWYVEQLRGAGVLVENKEVLEKYHLVIEKDKEGKDKQPKAEYQKAIGYTDSVIDTDKMQAKVGIIPNEIKSVVNSKMKRIKKTGIDWHYKIQAGFYGLGMRTEHYAVTIVSAEDLRSETHIFKTREMKRDVDNAIDAYDKAMTEFIADDRLPKFEPNDKVKWTANLKYAMFVEDWAIQSDSWAIRKMTELGII